LLKPLIFCLPTLAGQDFDVLRADAAGDFGVLAMFEDCSPFNGLDKMGSWLELLV
jgi:hypothetical protein